MLTSAQTNEFKQQLEREYARLLDEVGDELMRSNNEAFIDVAGKVHDMGDESVADLLSDLNIAAIERHINELRSIENALLRTKSGSYGICDKCSSEIELQRLQVQPDALRCIECQTRFEQTHAGERPSL